LDLVGERWTMLILRELTIRDSRYSDLRDALPGIATNLLADRLRQLEGHGILERYEAPRPIGATVYRLTPRAGALQPVVAALAAWGLPLLETGQNGDAFRSHWLVLALPVLFDGVGLDDLRPLTAVVRTGDEPILVEITEGRLSVRSGQPAPVDAVEVEGEPSAVVALFTGAGADGVSVRGAKDAVRRFRDLTARARTTPPPLLPM
jgi:DNA-binding HxlR family transcriptional regulator